MEYVSEYTMTQERKAALAKEFGLQWPSSISPVEFAIMDRLSRISLEGRDARRAQ
jgi:hypothetical protein